MCHDDDFLPPPSLASLLGVQDPKKPQEPPSPFPQKFTAKSLCKSLLATREYRESLLRRIMMDNLPPAVESKIWEYAYGKPVERLEVKDTTSDLSALTSEQLEARALKLAALARTLREGNDFAADESVH